MFRYQKSNTLHNISSNTKKGTTDETIKYDITKEKYFTRYNVKQRENRYTPAQRNLKKY